MWTLRALKIAAILTPILPAPAGYLLCRIIGCIFYVANLRARRQILDNFRRVMPGSSWFERQHAASRVFVTVITNYYDLLRLRTVDRNRLLDLVDVHGQEHLDHALALGRGVVILSAHMGNFGVVGQFPAVQGTEAAVIAERIDPPELFGYMSRLRSAMGLEVLPPGRDAIGPILRLLRRNGVLLVAGDRDVNHQGMLVDFFGEPASLPPGPILLAMRSGAALIPAFTIRTATRRSSVFVQPPLTLVRTRDHDADLRHNLRTMANCLEQMIRADPGQWAVLQRVWGPPSSYLVNRAEGLGSVTRDIQLPAELARERTSHRSRESNHASDSATR